MELFWYDIREMDAAAYAKALGQMSAARQKKVAELPNEDDRKRTVAAEWLLRKTLSQKLDVAPEQVAFKVDETESVTVADGKWYADMSHSGAWAVCAVNDTPIKVDVEVIRGVQEKFIDRTCNQAEKAYIHYGDAGCFRRFWECWTAKQALFQLTGKGPLLELSGLTLPEKVALDFVLRNGCAVTAAMVL